MRKEDVKALGESAFAHEIKPLLERHGRIGRAPVDVLGFDSEYDSKTHAQICYQLANVEKGALFRDRLTVRRLAKACRQMGVLGNECFLVAFFSIAELQFLPVVGKSTNWKLYGTGSLDVTFYDAKEDLSLHVFDLARFFDKQPLYKVAKAFGLAKLEWQRDRVKAADLKSAKFREYAINDALLCARIFAALRASLVGTDPLIYRTPAGCAAAHFRQSFLRETLKPPTPRVRLLAMLGTWGGRAEALERGQFEKLYEYDLKSAYPNAAIELGKMPTARAWKSAERLVGHAGFYQVRFRFPPRELYPCLPVQSRFGQVYPLAGETWATLSELSLAQRWGAKIEVLEGYTYDPRKGTSAVADYMRAVIAEREKAEGARKVALKLLANSLVGKFAQRVTGIDVESLRKIALRDGLDLRALLRLTIDELIALGVDNDPRIGAIFYPEFQGLITGHVRARISALARDTRAVYIATDAVWTEHRIRARLPADLDLKREGAGAVVRTRLGMIEDSREERAHVASHSIADFEVAEQLIRNPAAGIIVYSKARPRRLRESLRSGLSFGEWSIQSRTASAHWDEKRQLHKDGSTTPWGTVHDYEKARRESQKRKNNLRPT